MQNKKTFVLILLAIIISMNIFAQNKEDALLEYRNGNYNNAIKICKAEIDRMPNNLDSYVVMGWSYLKKGEYLNALECSQNGLKISKDDIRLIEILGEANYYKGNNKEALKNFQKYVSLAPTGDRIDLSYFFMGEIYIRLGEYKNADISFTTAVYHYPNSAKWWARLGYAREMAEDWKYSVEAYEQALKLSNSQKEAIRGLERVKKRLNG